MRAPDNGDAPAGASGATLYGRFRRRDSDSGVSRVGTGPVAALERFNTVRSVASG